MPPPPPATTSSGSATAEFSTRFLASDGIPDYNALLDGHLGKRREFLLGNMKALEMLQQTGAIARVERREDNPNQYIVVMHDKKSSSSLRDRKRLPPRAPSSGNNSNNNGAADGTSFSASAPSLPTTTSTTLVRKRPASSPSKRVDHTATTGARNTARESTNGMKHSETTPTLPAAEEPTFTFHQPTSLLPPSASSSRFATLKGIGRSQSTTALPRKIVTNSMVSPSPLLREQPDDPATTPSSLSSSSIGFDRRTSALSKRRYSQFEPPRSFSTVETVTTRKGSAVGALTTVQAGNSSVVEKKPQLGAKGTVEVLLENDAAYQTKILALRDELAILDQDKQQLDSEIAKLRKRIRGVNAVHENDVAVAHCSSIMQHRIAKAEEEYMKLVTAQQQVKTDIDRIRRELISLRKVQHKLEADIDDVTQVNTAIEAKVKQSRAMRNSLTEELSELERRAQIDMVERRNKLPPEEDVIVDADKLMRAVHERSTRRTKANISGNDDQDHSAGGTTVEGGDGSASPDRKTSSALATTTSKPALSFRSAFEVIKRTLGVNSLEAFSAEFLDTENELLSKHGMTMTLHEEAVALDKKYQQQLREHSSRVASIRGSYHESVAQQNELHSRVQATLSKIDSYNELRSQRNDESDRLRALMQRCLEILQAEKLVTRTESRTGPMLMSELSSPLMLETLQKKMTEVAIALKLKHNANQSNDAAAGKGPVRQHHAARRFNMFTTKEVSRIVLGPREPSGAAHAAIMLTAQAPSIDAAMALTECIGEPILFNAESPKKSPIQFSNTFKKISVLSPARGGAGLLSAAGGPQPQSHGHGHGHGHGSPARGRMMNKHASVSGASSPIGRIASRRVLRPQMSEKLSEDDDDAAATTVPFSKLHEMSR